ncbi:hypothetical protein WN944_014688 [Citrus x changshan-huyou]|uniref:Uncharacterized protein n=1 Tax=Citrus x changshan-huyou TaxID=2935761 RepID=A0AAP0M8B1_9ROSI
MQAIRCSIILYGAVADHFVILGHQNNLFVKMICGNVQIIFHFGIGEGCQFGKSFQVIFTLLALPKLFILVSRRNIVHDFEVDYESNENASIMYAALAVDKELQPDKVKRQISIVNGKLLVIIKSRCIFKSRIKAGLTCIIRNSNGVSWLPPSLGKLAQKIWRLLNALAILDGIKMALDSGLHPPLTVESNYFNAVKSILKKRLRMDDQRNARLCKKRKTVYSCNTLINNLRNL